MQGATLLKTESLMHTGALLTCVLMMFITKHLTLQACGQLHWFQTMAERLASIFGTEKDRVNCPFYFKIGACRHGDRCSRIHNRPTISPTIVLMNMYQRPDMITPGHTILGN